MIPFLFQSQITLMDLPVFKSIQPDVSTVKFYNSYHMLLCEGAQWLSGRVLDSRQKGRGFEPHRRHCVMYLSKNINPSLVLVQPRKTRPFITERLLMGRKESNQTNKHDVVLCHLLKSINH